MPERDAHEQKPLTTREPIRLVYTGKLPQMNKQHPSFWGRWNQKKTALRQFGVLPGSARATRKASVTIVRVLGPRQRPMDELENLGACLKGLADALVQGGYLVNDSPAWVSWNLSQDGSRRSRGPRVEITIRYIEEG